MPAAAKKIALTDRSMQAMLNKKNLPPAGKRLTVWDGVQPNLAVRVTDKGRLSFVVVRRRPGQAQPTWTVLGQYPALGLADAREKAREALRVLAGGEHPRRVEEARREAESKAERSREEGTFKAVAELFIQLHLPKLRTAHSGAALIRRELIPVLGERPIGEIRRRDIIALVEAIVARGVTEPGRRRPKSGGLYAAKHAFAALSKLFNWAVSRDVEGLEVNPMAGLKVADLLGPSQERQRVLNDDELRAVWGAAGAMGYAFGDLLRALILTGQRENEIARARWSEIDLDLPAPSLTVPAERMKSKNAHTVPLTPAVVAMLREMPRFAGGEFVFSTTGGRKPIGGFSKAVAQARALAGIAHWQVHDLRRTCRTGLASTGTLPFFAELVIGHAQSGVHGTYDKFRYNDEKREALLKWEKRLLDIVAPEPPNVVAMAARASA